MKEELEGRPNGKTVLSVEMALWVLVAALALVLRLVRLDAAPLNAQEAREAMLSWRAATGQGMPEGPYSPVLLALNALLFTLCGTSDSLARLWPALLGSALVLIPWLLRQRIGRVGALVAGLYLALSPTTLVASRQLDGATLVALGGMALLGGLVRFVETDPRATACRLWLGFSAGGLALAVTSSPSAYGMLLSMALSWLLLAWVWPDEGIRRMWERLRRPPRVRFWRSSPAQPGMASRWLACCSSSEPWVSRRRFHCTSGCPTRWKAPLRFRP